jgi:hypothetical protein
MTKIRLGIFLQDGQPLTPAFGKFQELNMEPGAKIKDIYNMAETWTGFRVSLGESKVDFGREKCVFSRKPFL